MDCVGCTSRGLLSILLITTVLSVQNYFLLQQTDRVKSSPILLSRGDDCTAREREPAKWLCRSKHSWEPSSQSSSLIARSPHYENEPHTPLDPVVKTRQRPHLDSLHEHVCARISKDSQGSLHHANAWVWHCLHFWGEEMTPIFSSYCSPTEKVLLDSYSKSISSSINTHIHSHYSICLKCPFPFKLVQIFGATDRLFLSVTPTKCPKTHQFSHFYKVLKSATEYFHLKPTPVGNFPCWDRKYYWQGAWCTWFLPEMQFSSGIYDGKDRVLPRATMAAPCKILGFTYFSKVTFFRSKVILPKVQSD